MSTTSFNRSATVTVLLSHTSVEIGVPPRPCNRAGLLLRRRVPCTCGWWADFVGVDQTPVISKELAPRIAAASEPVFREQVPQLVRLALLSYTLEAAFQA